MIQTQTMGRMNRPPTGKVTTTEALSAWEWERIVKLLSRALTCAEAERDLLRKAHEELLAAYEELRAERRD